MNDKKTKIPAKVVEIFEEGKKFTEEILRENERLRLAIISLKNEIRDLENRYVKVDMPRLRERLELLEQENRLLHEELNDIKAQHTAMEKENWDFSARYMAVERQNTSLLNLYVATQRLHSTLSFVGLVKIVKEIIINLIGSESFAICLYDARQKELVLLADEGPQPSADAGQLDDVVAGVIQSGAAYLAQNGKTGLVAGHSPVACIPLKLADQVMGVITIHHLLPQKAGLDPIDYELFELLGEHVAVAICASYSASTLGRETQGTRCDRLIREMCRGQA